MKACLILAALAALVSRHGPAAPGAAHGRHHDARRGACPRCDGAHGAASPRSCWRWSSEQRARTGEDHEDDIAQLPEMQSAEAATRALEHGVGLVSTLYRGRGCPKGRVVVDCRLAAMSPCSSGSKKTDDYLLRTDPHRKSTSLGEEPSSFAPRVPLFAQEGYSCEGSL